LRYRSRESFPRVFSLHVFVAPVSSALHPRL
jgi:hypothetical protein